MGKTRLALIIGACLLTLIFWAVAVAWFVFLHPVDGTQAQARDISKPAPAATPSVQAVPQEVSDAIAKLTSEPTGQISSSSPFRSNLGAAFPEGSATKTVPNTWDQGSDTTGTVDVDFASPGQPTHRYTALMIKENGAWKLLATVDEGQ